MSKFKNIEEFENLLKDNLGNHSVPAPPDVWSGVSSSVAGNSGSALSQFTSYFSSLSNILKVAFFVSGISAVGIVLYNENTKEIPTDSPNTPTIDQVDASDNSTTNENEAASTDKPLENNEASSKSRNTADASTQSENSPTNQAGSNTDLAITTSKDEQAQDQPSPAAESGQKSSILKNNQVVLSNSKPCIGEKITLSNAQNRKGDWFINGKKVSENSSIINYVWTSSKNTLIEFKSDSAIIKKQIGSAVAKTTILASNTTEDQYVFNLASSEIIANWYVDGKLITTNAKQLNYNFETVGMHHVKAVPVNHACSSPIETHITIKAKGELKTYNFFSPNGDGKNDTYQVEISNYEMYSIQIFNSENVKVFASNNPAISWDGTEFNSGKECTNGEYAAKIVYKLVGEESTIKNIKLTLIRN